MIKVIKQSEGKVTLAINNIKIDLNLNNGKIWLTKDEIEDVFWIDNNLIDQTLLSMKNESNQFFNKNIKKTFNTTTKQQKIFYSIDIIINIWYRINDFQTTKLIIQINRNLKDLKINKKTLLTIFKEKLERFSVEDFFEKKYILNLQ